MYLQTFATRAIITTVVALLLSAAPATVTAQPTADQLAERLERVYQERIASISHLEITTVMQNGMFEGMESTSVFEKVIRDGRSQLVQVDVEELYEGLFEGLFDDVLPELVRNSTSITMDRFEGQEVYHVLVDDVEFLQQLEAGESIVDDEIAGEYQIESATILIDSQQLVVRHLTFRQVADGGKELAVHFTLSDYRTHSGLPIPHRMSFVLEGLEQLISDDQIQQARMAMQQMEEQLAQMPEDQRRMIEEQLMPRMQQFEAMLEQEDPGSAEIEVTRVSVH